MKKRCPSSRLVVPISSRLVTSALFLFFSAYCLLPAAYCLLPSDDARLLETGRAAKAAAVPPATDELKVVSYNMRYRAGEDLKRVVELLRNDPEVGGSAVIGLQEVDRNKKRTGHTNTARAMAEALGMNYVWAAPPNARPKDGEQKRVGEAEEEETGVAILSPYPLTDVARIVLAHEGPNRRRRAAIGATVRVGDVSLRVYSVHAETRMPVAKKVEHWGAVLEDLKRHPHVRHVVVLGDFNTIKGKDVRAARRLFTGAGFHTPFPDSEETFKVLFLDFKLDWIWLRGLKAGDYGIDKEIGLSDHWPLWAKVKLDKPGAPSLTALPASLK